MMENPIMDDEYDEHGVPRILGNLQMALALSLIVSSHGLTYFHAYWRQCDQVCEWGSQPVNCDTILYVFPCLWQLVCSYCPFKCEDWKMLDLAEVGNGVWDDGFGKDGLRPFELATIRLQRLSWASDSCRLGACFAGGCFCHCCFWMFVAGALTEIHLKTSTWFHLPNQVI